MKFKRELIPEEIAILESLCSYRMPMDQIAKILGLGHKVTLERMMKHRPAIREAVDRGRAKGSAAVYQTAFQMATSGKDAGMTQFWLKTQEGWRETMHLELSGPGGGPIPIEQMDRKQREARIEHLLKVRAQITGKIERDAKPVEVEPESSEIIVDEDGQPDIDAIMGPKEKT